MDALPSEGSVALSWGAAVQSVVEAVPTAPHHGGLEVLPLVGGLSIVDSARDGNVLVRSLASRLGARHRRLYAPAVVESAASRDALMRETAIRSVLDAAKDADVAVVGLGAVGRGASSAIVESMRLSAEEHREFLASGVVGDCCTRYFDAEGRPAEALVNERVIAVELEDLRRIPLVAGVAAGIGKLDGTLGALRGGFLDVLVVDAELATALLDHD